MDKQLTEAKRLLHEGKPDEALSIAMPLLDSEAADWRAKLLVACGLRMIGRFSGALNQLDEILDDPNAQRPARLELTRLRKAMQLAESTANDPTKGGTQRRLTSYDLPTTDELEQYRQARIARAKIDTNVDAWQGLPVWAKTTKLGCLIVFIAIALLAVGIILSVIFKW